MTGMDNTTREEWMVSLKKAIENCKKDKAANEKAKAKGYHNLQKEIVGSLFPGFYAFIGGVKVIIITTPP